MSPHTRLERLNDGMALIHADEAPDVEVKELVESWMRGDPKYDGPVGHSHPGIQRCYISHYAPFWAPHPSDRNTDVKAKESRKAPHATEDDQARRARAR